MTTIGFIVKKYRDDIIESPIGLVYYFTLYNDQSFLLFFFDYSSAKNNQLQTLKVTILSRSLSFHFSYFRYSYKHHYTITQLIVRSIDYGCGNLNFRKNWLRSQLSIISRMSDSARC